MAQQYLQPSPPFMAKETFDQVSTVMWGHNALDYYKNYLTPRYLWSYFDIREEALFYAGLAHGIRSRQVGSGALQKPNPPMIYRGNPTLGSSGNDYQSGYNQMLSTFRTPGGSWTGRQPQTIRQPQSSLHPGWTTPYSKTTDMAFGKQCSPNYARNTLPEVHSWSPLAYGVVSPGDSGSDASTGQYSTRPLNPVASTSHNLPSGSGTPQGYPNAAQLQQMQRQALMQAARREDNVMFPWMPTSQTSTALPVPKTTAPSTTPRLADPQQIANATADRAGALGRANAFGEHSVLGEKTPSIPLTDNKVSHHRAQETIHDSTSQTPGAGLKETGGLTATVEDPSEEDSSDEDYPEIDSPSVREESCHCGGSTNTIEAWFEE